MNINRFGQAPRKRIYFISPLNPENFWTMQSSVDALGAKSTMPSITFATLLGLIPGDLNIECVFCDENVSKLDLNMKCDLVAITGFTLHWDRMKELSIAFRKRNISVAIGGPYASLYPDQVKDYADHLFVGEGEYTWPQFLKDWIKGKAAPVYEQKTFVDIKDSKPANWSFINGRDYLYFPVQTSRGCPNNCDFCDAIRLVGRRYRTKSIDQVMREIKNAHAARADVVFFSEDNFFVNKSFTKELLTEIIKWNRAQTRPLSFSTQATIRIGDDEEILKLLADAKFSVIFLGVESTRKACLDEINKGHIFRHNPEKAVARISSFGIIPFIGLIVGFDNDDESIFYELETFLEKTGSPICSISILNAPKGTVLYDRMKEQGRIKDDLVGEWHFSSNIIPLNMSQEELQSRHLTFFKRLYEPEIFERRILKWLANIQYFTDKYTKSKPNYPKLFKFYYILKFYLFHEPKPVRQLFFRVLHKTWKINPRLVKKAITIMSQYCHYYDFANKDTNVPSGKSRFF